MDGIAYSWGQKGGGRGRRLCSQALWHIHSWHNKALKVWKKLKIHNVVIDFSFKWPTVIASEMYSIVGRSEILIL